MAITIYGPAISTYVRSTRLACEEKGAPYDLVELDIVQGANRAPAHLARQPFGVVPAFEHDGFALYETSAILRYLDRALDGPALQPQDLQALARMDQAMAIIDAYGYPSMITGIVMQRLVAPMLGGVADEAVIESVRPRAETTVRELARLLGENRWLAGQELSLADLHLAPIIAYFRETPEGQAMLKPHPSLARWWEAIAGRSGMQKTAPRFG
jgi:glutathione S-transferase